jgi:hypothetical protein
MFPNDVMHQTRHVEQHPGGDAIGPRCPRLERVTGRTHPHTVDVMKASVSETLQRAVSFFMGTSDIQLAANRITKELDAMGIPFAIAGAIAVGTHGHRRMTEDLDLLMRREDLARFKEKNLGLGWVEKFAGSKGIRDVVANVPIDILLTGDYPGDGLEKPIAFPAPEDATERDANGWPVLTLKNVIELKLASGMSARSRIQDFADVIQLIKRNELPNEFGTQLNPYVLDAWNTYWSDAQERLGEY